MRRAISPRPREESATPSTSIPPPCGSTNPSRVLKRVVLPPPFGPSTHRTSPAPSVKLTPRPMVRPGKPKSSALTSSITSSCLQRASPAPSGESEEPEEKRRADQRRQHTGRHFDGGDRAAQRIDREQEGGAEQHGERQQAAEVRTDQQARGVRDEQPDP